MVWPGHPLLRDSASKVSRKRQMLRTWRGRYRQAETYTTKDQDPNSPFDRCVALYSSSTLELQRFTRRRGAHGLSP